MAHEIIERVARTYYEATVSKDDPLARLLTAMQTAPTMPWDDLPPRARAAYCETVENVGRAYSACGFGPARVILAFEDERPEPAPPRRDSYHTFKLGCACDACTKAAR